MKHCGDIRHGIREVHLIKCSRVHAGCWQSCDFRGHEGEMEPFPLALVVWSIIFLPRLARCVGRVARKESQQKTTRRECLEIDQRDSCSLLFSIIPTGVHSFLRAQPSIQYFLRGIGRDEVIRRGQTSGIDRNRVDARVRVASPFHTRVLPEPRLPQRLSRRSPSSVVMPIGQEELIELLSMLPMHSCTVPKKHVLYADLLPAPLRQTATGNGR